MYQYYYAIVRSLLKKINGNVVKRLYEQINASIRERVYHSRSFSCTKSLREKAVLNIMRIFFQCSPIFARIPFIPFSRIFFSRSLKSQNYEIKMHAKIFVFNNIKKTVQNESRVERYQPVYFFHMKTKTTTTITYLHKSNRLK